MKFYQSLPFIILISSCAVYQEEKLDTQLLSQQIITDLNSNTQLGEDSVLNFHEALALMSVNNPELKTYKLNYQNSLKMAGIATPLPNPEISVGSETAFNLNEKNAAATQPFVHLAFSIPLNGRLKLSDELKKITAEKKFFELINQHRHLYFELRQSFMAIALQQELIQQHKKQLLLHEKWLKSKKQNSSLYSDIEIRESVLQVSEQQNLLDESEQQNLQNHRQLEHLLNSSFSKLYVENPVESFQPLQSLEEIWQIGLENNFQLNETLLDYKIAEKELELAIRKQYPDLKIGSGFQQEAGDDKKLLSISVGIDLPIFDRNQTGIQEALNRRESVRQTYQNQLSSLRINLSNNLKLLQEKYSQHDNYKKNVVNNMTELVKIAEKSIQNGELSLSRYFEIMVHAFEVEKKHLQQKLEILTLMNQIEKQIGKPIFEIFNSDKIIFNEIKGTVK